MILLDRFLYVSIGLDALAIFMTVASLAVASSSHKPGEIERAAKVGVIGLALTGVFAILPAAYGVGAVVNYLTRPV